MCEWISVKDRLPLAQYILDGGGARLCGTFIVHFSDHTDPNERSHVGFADYVTGVGWHYPASLKPHTYWADKITHWMELPDAPREFQEEAECENWIE